MLNGCGAGYSVQKHHVEKLPNIQQKINGKKIYKIEDSIEGWSDAIGVLISSYLSTDYKVTFPEYQGFRVDFNYSKIRKKGSLISGGFKAPGPEGLRQSILKIEQLLDSRLDEGTLRTIDVYDTLMHMSDAVLSGGVRRSASICLFHKDDELLLNAKTGDWFNTNPQRARSNNSVMLLRDSVTPLLS